MSDFAGMEDLMQDFLIESSGLLSDIDNLLPVLEGSPDESSILNEIFRNFHTIKGGAGFLNAAELAALCHLAEGLFDKLCHGELALDADLMEVIRAVMSELRRMLGSLSENVQPAAAPAILTDTLKSLLEDKRPVARSQAVPPAPVPVRENGPNWNVLYQSLTGSPSGTAQEPEPTSLPSGQNPPEVPTQAYGRAGRRATDSRPRHASAGYGRRSAAEDDGTLRVEAGRLDQAAKLAGELAGIRDSLVLLRSTPATKSSRAARLEALDASISRIDALQRDLGTAIARVRMQPIGRLFGKYRLLADDLSRRLNKKVELILDGEESELDARVIDRLNEPLVHLLRNALIHGLEDADQRITVGKPRTGQLRLGARQEDNRFIITLADDGRGMRAEAIRARAVEQGLLDTAAANRLTREECMELLFLPGYACRNPAASNGEDSGGLNKAQACLRELGATLALATESGAGCEFSITLPLRLGLLQVRQLGLNGQLLAIPCSLVRDVFPLSRSDLQQVSGQTIMQVHGEVLGVVPLAGLIGWKEKKRPKLGVHIRSGDHDLILAVDSDAGPGEVAFRSMDTLRPRGVAGSSLSGDGRIVLILDVRELLADMLM
jgi:two-component system chemotaxis sensor kinase CheA